MKFKLNCVPITSTQALIKEYNKNSNVLQKTQMHIISENADFARIIKILKIFILMKLFCSYIILKIKYVFISFYIFLNY